MRKDLTEIEALIHLLDDPDNSIYKEVSQRLYAIGRPAVFGLEKSWNLYSSKIFRERVEYLIHDIHIHWVSENLHKWITVESDNLFRGAFIISTIQYPELEEDDLLLYFDEIQKDINLELGFSLTPLEKIQAFNHVFFEIHKFSGNYSNYYSPFNNYINYVFEGKKGNPLSLSIIYSIIAQRINLPIYGVNLPRNFILSWVENYETNYQDVTFYLNPYNKGVVLGKREIDMFLQQQSIEPNQSYFQPCSNKDMIKRLLINLVAAYEKSGNTQRVNDLNSLLLLF